MSTGSIIGGIVGAVIGGIIGGVPGAYIGFTIGFGAGALIDPLTPDIPSPGQPELGNLNISTSDEGPPIKDVLGTTKIASGNIIWHCCQRVVEVTKEVEVPGGKGGGGTETVHAGWEYFVSWALGLCMGPVDTLYTVYNGDDVVWSGELNRPAAGGEETIVLTGMGSITFYFGTDDQVANAVIGSKLADPTLNTPYRHLCWAFFNDCSTGSQERVPTMKFVLRKSPVFAFNANEVIGVYDYNPAHAMYYILHTMLEIPASIIEGELNYLNTTAFSNVADTLFAEERGISILFGSQTAALSYLEESILPHTDGIIRWGNDGKFHPKLIRADEAVVDLPSFDENQMLDTLKMERRSWYDTLNEVRVEYSERIYPGFEYSEGKITLIDSWIFDSEYSAATIHGTITTPAYDDILVPSFYGVSYVMMVGSGYKRHYHPWGDWWSNTTKFWTFPVYTDTGLILKSLPAVRTKEPVYQEVPAPNNEFEWNFGQGFLVGQIANTWGNWFMVSGCFATYSPVGALSSILQSGLFTFGSVNGHFVDYGLLATNRSTWGSTVLEVPDNLGAYTPGPPRPGDSDINAGVYRSVDLMANDAYLTTFTARSTILGPVGTFLIGDKIVFSMVWSEDGLMLIIAYKIWASSTSEGIMTFRVNENGTFDSLLDTWEFPSFFNSNAMTVLHMHGDIYFACHSSPTQVRLRTFSVNSSTGIITEIDDHTVSSQNSHCRAIKVDNYTVAIVLKNLISASDEIHTYRVYPSGNIESTPLDTYTGLGAGDSKIYNLTHISGKYYYTPSAAPWTDASDDRHGISSIYTWKID